MDTVPPLYNRTSTRHYSAHHALLEAASIHLEICEQEEPRWFYSALVSITFSALAVEAFVNAVGERLIADWKDDYESASTALKIRLLAEKLDIPYSSRSEPWVSIKWLGRFRNQIVHAKPERVETKSVVGRAKQRHRYVEAPESALEREVTLGNAKRAVATMRDLKLLFCDRIPIEEQDGLSTDGWSAVTEGRHVVSQVTPSK